MKVKYIKEALYNTYKGFEKEIEVLLNEGWELKEFNSYGTGGNHGISVALFIKNDKKVSI